MATRTQQSSARRRFPFNLGIIIVLLAASVVGIIILMLPPGVSKDAEHVQTAVAALSNGGEHEVQVLENQPAVAAGAPDNGPNGRWEKECAQGDDWYKASDFESSLNYGARYFRIGSNETTTLLWIEGDTVFMAFSDTQGIFTNASLIMGSMPLAEFKTAWNTYAIPLVRGRVNFLLTSVVTNAKQVSRQEVDALMHLSKNCSS